MMEDVYLTEKAMALLAAIEAGFLQEDKDGNIDDEAFHVFWDDFTLRRDLKHSQLKILTWCLPWSIALISTTLLICTIL